MNFAIVGFTDFQITFFTSKDKSKYEQFVQNCCKSRLKRYKWAVTFSYFLFSSCVFPSGNETWHPSLKTRPWSGSRALAQIMFAWLDPGRVLIGHPHFLWNVFLELYPDSGQTWHPIMGSKFNCQKWAKDGNHVWPMVRIVEKFRHFFKAEICINNFVCYLFYFVRKKINDNRKFIRNFVVM